MFDQADVSHWHAALSPTARRASLTEDIVADVVIVGAGYTGLWTAYYLKQNAPDLDIVVLEANFVGFGASGRNGGWCSPVLAGLDEWIDAPETRQAALILQSQMLDAVDEVGRVSQRENMDCDYAKDGHISVAVTPRQERRLKNEFEGYTEEDTDFRMAWISGPDVSKYVNITGARAAILSPQCAVIHPAKLVAGLAIAVERRGVRIFENSAARDIAARRVKTEKGEVTAQQVVIATEGYSDKTPALARRLVPIHSQLIVTEPLSDEIWQEIGLKDRLLFNDGRALVTYGQRTADHRIALGYHARYLFGSGIQDMFDVDDPSFDIIRDILVSFFPVLENTKIDRCWGGVLGVSRDMAAFVHYDPSTKIGWAGGYTGDGVAASNLAGRTLADLLLGLKTERASTPWVRSCDSPLKMFSHWEPEPIRWLGVQGIRTMLGISDWLENFSTTRQVSRRARR